MPGLKKGLNYGLFLMAVSLIPCYTEENFGSIIMQFAKWNDNATTLAFNLEDGV